MPPKKSNPPGNRRPRRGAAAAAQKAADKKPQSRAPAEGRGLSAAVDTFEESILAALNEPAPKTREERRARGGQAVPWINDDGEDFEDDEVWGEPRSSRRGAATTKPAAAPKKPTPPKQSSTTKKRPHPSHDEAAMTTTDEDEDEEPAIPTSSKKRKKGDQRQQKERPRAAQPLDPEANFVDTDDENDFHQARPAYVSHTYAHMQDRLRALVGEQSPADGVATAAKPGLIRAFAAKHFGFETLFSEDDDEILEKLRGMDAHAALLVGCVADGGPRGVDGWLELFKDPLERQALVCAVVGKVLEEHVFASLCFGATEEQLEELHEEVDLKHRDFPEDGFTRARRRHHRIRTIIKDAAAAANTTPFGLTPDFFPAAKLLAWQLHTILEPIRSLSAGPSSPSLPAKARQHAPSAAAAAAAARRAATHAIVRDLHRIVARAGILSLHMRLDASTVYHATGAGKGDFWNEAEMRAFNRARMVERNPTAQGYDGSARSGERMRRARRQLALVRTAIWPAWKAFRKGGWGAGEKGRGLRVCELGRQWVGLRWGEQRRWWDRPEAAGVPEVEGPAAAKGKGKATGKAKKADADVDEEKPRWEEWLMIWAEGQKNPRKVLEDTKDWFSFSVPGEELESEVEVVDDYDDDEEEEEEEDESDF